MVSKVTAKQKNTLVMSFFGGDFMFHFGFLLQVMEVTSPTAGSVLVDVSQLQILQVCQEVSVKTVSLYGESADSVPAQIPSALLGDVGWSSPSVATCLTSQLPHGEAEAHFTPQTSQEHSASFSADNPVAKFTSQPKADSEDSVNSPDVEFSRCSVPTRPPLTRMLQAQTRESGTSPGEEGESLVPSTKSIAAEDSAKPRKEPRKDNQVGMMAA